MALCSSVAERPKRVALLLSIVTPLFLGAHLAAWLINASPDHHVDAAWMASTFGSTVGKVELWRVGLSLLPLWALGLARRPRLALGLTIPPIIVSAAVGHSAAIHPMWAIPFKAIHLIALALWMGGLSWIVLRERADSERLASDTVRVSTIALWAVVAVTISGIVQTLMLVQTIAGIRSAYGVVVVAKVAGLVILVAFGAYHRRRLVGAIASRGELAIATLRSSVARELSVFCVVILLGGFLAYLSPPISRDTSARSHSLETRP
jgi:putative copper export protein